MNILEEWLQLLNNSFTSLWEGFLGILPEIVGAVLVIIIGWIVAVNVGLLVRQIVKVLNIDELLKRIGTTQVMKRAGIELSAGKFLGWLVQWFLILVFVLAAVDILGLTEVSAFLQSIALYIPRVIVAAIILLVGVLVADVAHKVIKRSADAANLLSGDFVATVVRWAILIFSILAALLQLKVAEDLIRILFIGIVAMVAIAGGIAFGLGGRETATRLLGRLEHDMSARKGGMDRDME